MLTAALLLAAPITFTGCGTLDPAGSYSGDKVLYDADMTISLAYDTVHNFVTWEYQNRAALSGLPQIKEYANALRSQYPTWHRAALAARQAYIGNPNDPNRTALQQALDVLREAMRQANQWLATTQTPILETK